MSGAEGEGRAGGPIAGRVVVALGGNALLRRGETPTIAIQRANLARAANALAAVVAQGWEIVVTHGNGPQVGLLAIEAELAASVVPPPPLDVLGAESQGQIGYLLAAALEEAFAGHGVEKRVAVVLTRTVVDPADPAFRHPSKPVGPVYDESAARRLAAERGWEMAPDGAGWRRVVPSPRPLGLVEVPIVRRLADEGLVVVAAGGGGIPVAVAEGGRLEGVEAVVDKDLTAVVLAEGVAASHLLILTDVDAVYRGWGRPGAAPIRRLTVAQGRRLLARRELASGSMGPKVEAAVAFVAGGPGRHAAIGALEAAAEVLAGRAGTQVAPAAVHRLPSSGPAGRRTA
jgi:carbamate kinase